MGIGMIILLVVVVFILSGLRLLYQYHRGVVFTLGRFSGVLEPGLRWIVPVIQTMRRVDMRIMTADIPRQEVITKDNIPILANIVTSRDPWKGIGTESDVGAIAKQFRQTIE